MAVAAGDVLAWTATPLVAYTAAAGVSFWDAALGTAVNITQRYGGLYRLAVHTAAPSVAMLSVAFNGSRGVCH